jgi:hypothetical protein
MSELHHHFLFSQQHPLTHLHTTHLLNNFYLALVELTRQSIEVSTHLLALSLTASDFRVLAFT